MVAPLLLNHLEFSPSGASWKKRGNGLTTTVRANRGGQISEGLELFHPARARHLQQTGDSGLSGLTPIAEHDFAPLHCRAQRTFGAVVGRLHAFVMHEDETLLTLCEERRRQIAHVIVRAVQMPLAVRKEIQVRLAACCACYFCGDANAAIIRETPEAHPTPTGVSPVTRRFAGAGCFAVGHAARRITRKFAVLVGR